MAKGTGSKSRSWCFTIFPKCEDECPWDPDTIDWHEQPGKPIAIIAGLETTKEGRIHWQGAIRFKNPTALATAKSSLGEPSAHLEPTRGSWKQAYEYCLKGDSKVGYTDEHDSDKITFIWPDEGALTEGGMPDKDERQDHYAIALQLGSYQEAIEYLTLTRARDMCLHGPSIKSNVRIYFEERDIQERIPKSYRRDFFHSRLDRKCVLLSGKPGTGKTEFALDHFKFPLLVRHTEDLKRLHSKHDGLVFDDISFHNWSPQNVIHLMDLAHGSTINVKHSSVHIPAGLPRIFTCNRSFDEWCPSECNDNEKGAIRRRVDVLNVFNDLFNPIVQEVVNVSPQNSQ